MYRDDDTQPILLDSHDTAVFAHPGAAMAPTPGTPVSRRVLYVLIAVLLVAAGAVGGGYLVAAGTATMAEVEAQRSAAQQAGYDAGYEAGYQTGSDDSQRGAQDAAERAAEQGYREGFEDGRAAGVASVQPAPAPEADPQQPQPDQED